MRRAVTARCRERFGTLSQAEEHAPRHEKRRWLDHTHEQPRPGRRWNAHEIARYESCSLGVERIQPELPGPREALAGAAQHECSIGIDDGYRESLTTANGNLVTDG